MAKEGTVANFGTLGGSTVRFVYEGGPYDYGRMTCGGCHVDERAKVGEANDHAAQCRAR